MRFSLPTGADVHELFVAWAVLALPFALAARFGAAPSGYGFLLSILGSGPNQIAATSA